MTPEALGTIKNISFRPVKGGGAIETQMVKLTPAGIEGDHDFAVVRAIPDRNGVFHFITQRDKRNNNDQPQGLAVLSLIQPQYIDGDLHLTWQGSDAIELPDDINSGGEMHVKIWDDVVHAVDQGDKLSKWLSEHLGLDVRLVKAAGSFSRKADQDYLKNDNAIRFHDGYPIHWFLQESIDELSGIAGEEVPWQTFRPNFVVSGSPAQTEHTVLAGEVAEIPFFDAVPSQRCIVTNVDQETGVVKPGRARTHLNKYKRWRNVRGERKVIFGEYMLPQGSGDVAVGDEIVLIERRMPPLVYGANV